MARNMQCPHCRRMVRIKWRFRWKLVGVGFGSALGWVVVYPKNLGLYVQPFQGDCPQFSQRGAVSLRQKYLPGCPYKNVSCSLSIKTRFDPHRQIATTGPSAHVLFGACGRLRPPTLRGRSRAGVECRERAGRAVRRQRRVCAAGPADGRCQSR